MSRVQAESNEKVHWIDCGFYLLPVTLSKLSRFGLSNVSNVKFVNPLASKCTMDDQLFESVGSFVDADVEELVEKSIEKSVKYSKNRFNCSYPMFPRIFYLYLCKWI